MYPPSVARKTLNIPGLSRKILEGLRHEDLPSFARLSRTEAKTVKTEIKNTCDFLTDHWKKCYFYDYRKDKDEKRNLRFEPKFPSNMSPQMKEKCRMECLDHCGEWMKDIILEFEDILRAPEIQLISSEGKIYTKRKSPYGSYLSIVIYNTLDLETITTYHFTTFDNPEGTWRRTAGGLKSGDKTIDELVLELCEFKKSKNVSAEIQGNFSVNAGAGAEADISDISDIPVVPTQRKSQIKGPKSTLPIWRKMNTFEPNYNKVVIPLFNSRNYIGTYGS